MGYKPRVSIPSLGGTYSRILSESAIENQLRTQHGDNSYIVAVLIVAWTSLLADSPIFNNHKPDRVINRFLTGLVGDLFGIVEHQGRLADALIRTLERDPSGEGIIINAYLKDFEKTPIFREYLEFYKSHDTSLLRYILTFLLFGKKVSYVDESLNAKALRSWREVEDRLEHSELPDFTSNLRYIMTWLFDDFEAGEFLPTHGSGSVAERGIWGIEGKNQIFGIDPKLDMYYRQTISDRPGMTGYRDVNLQDHISYPSPDGETPSVRKNEDSVARLMFVPKDLKKSRSICMEPVDFQHAQQGVRLWYEDHLSKCALKNHVFIKDQSKNQEACRRGSVTSNLDTIDLSSASDSVQLALVRGIYPPKVLKHLLATRSRFVLVSKGTDPIEVKKFAPMGSALCFPVQSTIYSAVILMVSYAMLYGRDWREDGSITDLDLDAAYVVSYGKSQGKWKPAFSNFYVYGDDLVTDNAITSNVIEALERLSFRVNEEKSFVGNSAYRESCGVHYCAGEDITPLLFKTKFFSQGIDVESLGSVIDLANRAGDYGYVNLRRHMVQLALYYDITGQPAKPAGKQNPILFTSDRDDSFALHHSDPRNTHLRSRSPSQVPMRKGVPRIRKRDTHVRFQRNEVFSITVGPDESRKLSRNYDNYRHVVWWRSRYHKDEEVQPQSVPINSISTRDIAVLEPLSGQKPTTRILRTIALQLAEKEREGRPMTADARGVKPAWRWTAR